MTDTLRRHVMLPPEAVNLLEEYQASHGLRSFSSAVEAAVAALARQERQAAYQRYARDYAEDAGEQRDAEAWLGLPMDEGESRA